MIFEKSSLDGCSFSCYCAPFWRRKNPYEIAPRLLVCFLLASLMAHGQGVGASGEITGTVTDYPGAAVLNATVNVVDTQTGLPRTVTTDNTGQFRVTGLSPATYDVRARMPGFATEIRKGVAVAVGQTVVSDFD